MKAKTLISYHIINQQIKLIDKTILTLYILSRHFLHFLESFRSNFFKLKGETYEAVAYSDLTKTNSEKKVVNKSKINYVWDFWLKPVAKIRPI